MAIQLKTDGTITKMVPKNGTDFTTEELQNAVATGTDDPLFEIITLAIGTHRRLIMIVNESGLVFNLKPNRYASQIAEQGFVFTYPLVGDCLLAVMVDAGKPTEMIF